MSHEQDTTLSVMHNVLLEALEAKYLSPEERLEIISEYAMREGAEAVGMARQSVMNMGGIPRGFGEAYHHGFLLGRHGVERTVTYTGEALKEWECGVYFGKLISKQDC